MSHILPGLKGDDWEEALLITRPRGRGVPRVVDEPENLSLIFNYRESDIDFSKVDKIRDFLRAEYNLNASKRSVTEALKIIRGEHNERTVRKIIAQNSERPLPNECRVWDLLRDELSWIDSTSKLWIVAEALGRLGYRRMSDRLGFAVWIKKIPPHGEGQV